MPNHAADATPGAGLGRSVGKRLTAAMHLEGYGGRRFRPRCAACWAIGVVTPHPEANLPANAPPVPGVTCPACGTPAEAPGPYEEEPAVFTGTDPATVAGRVLKAIGGWLKRLSERM